MRGQIQKLTFDYIDRISNSSGVDSIMQVLSSAGSDFGYENFSIAGLPSPGESIDPYIMACGWPEGWAARYREENYVHLDPVIKEVRRSDRPFMWSKAPIKDTDIEAKKVMNEATEFGLVEGFAVPIYTTHGFQAIVTFGATKLILSDSEQAALHMVAIYAHQAIRSLLPNNGKQSDYWKLDRQLSLREIECLKWTAAGKTSYEISMITGLSARTIENYIANAVQKLDAVNRVQAVAQALRYHVIV